MTFFIIILTLILFITFLAIIGSLYNISKVNLIFLLLMNILFILLFLIRIKEIQLLSILLGLLFLGGVLIYISIIFINKDSNITITTNNTNKINFLNNIKKLFTNLFINNKQYKNLNLYISIFCLSTLLFINNFFLKIKTLSIYNNLCNIYNIFVNDYLNSWIVLTTISKDYNIEWKVDFEHGNKTGWDLFPENELHGVNFNINISNNCIFREIKDSIFYVYSHHGTLFIVIIILMFVIVILIIKYVRKFK